MPIIPIKKAVNQPLLRQELEAARIEFRFIFGAGGALELDAPDEAIAILEAHDASKLTPDQTATVTRKNATEQFIAAAQTQKAALASLVSSIDADLALIAADRDLNDATRGYLTRMNLRTKAAIVAQQPAFDIAELLARQWLGNAAAGAAQSA